ncbi:CotH kinase family protein [Mesonia aestuariivivens]|uniref:CotH kinase family protein n=1 Tax=Mesonia aestuariivivens TaxID=2796128 RepID=A0ABS6W1M1_9FLAO|nr:CotH kinase family protein [Mesonia aestuariivivens]MBW2961019.1 CotH kinase family protein [Mesonia aestuariivivens]
MNINGGFRIHGNNSRALAIKNLRLYARSDYSSEDKFEHDLFNVAITDAPVYNNNEYKRIMLRGNGSGGSIAYDVVFNRVMQPIYNGVARIQPAIHFINGEFWGLTAIRDRMDKRHYALNFDLDDDEILIIDCKGVNCDLDEGEDADYDEYIAMRDFILDNDLSVQANYDQAANLLDMESYIDHMILEVFAANDSYERAFWKVRTPVNNKYGDGKWRVSMQDFEASLKDNINWLENWTDLNNASNDALLNSLFASTQFQNQFINRFADVLNTVLNTTYFNEVVNFTFDEVSPYLAEDE